MSTASTLPAGLLMLLTLIGSPAALAADYVVDPEHTYASFEIDHLGFSTQRGQFRHSEGSISFDPESKQGEIDISIASASIDTGLELRDKVLRGDGWFKVNDFPNILFRSRQLIFDGERLVAVDGTLMLLGEIRPQRLEIQRFKCGFSLASRKQTCGADATATLRRSAFGMDNLIPFVGDEVRLHIQVEAQLR